ncbi:MAG: hypothetical protein V4477_14355 [Pseudomonadota bacterium]
MAATGTIAMENVARIVAGGEFMVDGTLTQNSAAFPNTGDTTFG